MLVGFLGGGEGSVEVGEMLSMSEARRKNDADEVVGATTERRCKAVALERTPSGEDTKLGEVVRVSDFRPESFVGGSADSGVGSSPVTDISLSGLSERGARLRPAG